MIEHWYLACMILVTGPFNWHHVVTLTFDLLQGQICCWAGDHNSPNLLVQITAHMHSKETQNCTQMHNMWSFWVSVFHKQIEPQGRADFDGQSNCWGLSYIAVELSICPIFYLSNILLTLVNDCTLALICKEWSLVQVNCAFQMIACSFENRTKIRSPLYVTLIDSALQMIMTCPTFIFTCCGTREVKCDIGNLITLSVRPSVKLCFCWCHIRGLSGKYENALKTEGNSSSNMKLFLFLYLRII